MNRKILISVFVFSFLMSCDNKKEVKPETAKQPELNAPAKDLKMILEKIVVADLKEICVTYFKVKVENPNQKTIVLLDNNLSDLQLNGWKTEESGFYLKGKKNDSLIMLGIDRDYFYKIGPRKSGYLFIAGWNLKGSEIKKDSLAFKQSLANFNLEYNGEKLDLFKVEKSKYISTKDYEEFIEGRKNFVPYKISLSLPIHEKKIPLSYINELPVTMEEWNKL